jgi:oxygen-dependent protoporphyrinogen oxidase
MTKKNLSIGVLGGGITGLTTAYVLKKQGVQVSVYEKKEQPGGAIRSRRIKNWLVEEGPNTLQVKSKEVWDLLKELGLQDDIVEADQKAKKRYIAKDQTPVPLPHSMGEFLTTPLLSPVGKLRLLGEPLISASTKDDESVASFIRRRLGQQPLDYGVNPFVSGIFAGEPEQLSIKHTFSSLWKLEQNHGSLVKGMFAKMKSKKRKQDPPRKALISFKEGLRQLPKAIAL